MATLAARGCAAGSAARTVPQTDFAKIAGSVHVAQRGSKGFEIVTPGKYTASSAATLATF